MFAQSLGQPHCVNKVPCTCQQRWKRVNGRVASLGVLLKIAGSGYLCNINLSLVNVQGPLTPNLWFDQAFNEVLIVEVLSDVVVQIRDLDENIIMASKPTLTLIF